MSFARRSGQRFTANAWPGFVDAMTALLLVLMFVLSIFMIVQFILSERIGVQDAELRDLGQELDGLARALGLEQERAAVLEDDLAAASSEQERQLALIATLTAEREELTGQVASFEQQVAGLLSEQARLTGALAEVEGARDALAGELTTTEAELTRIIDEREALQLALASAREEIDATAEQARLAAARADAVQALVAELEAEAQTREASLAQTLASLEQAEGRLETTQGESAALAAALDEAQAALSDEEAARLAEAAAAQALRERLADAEGALSQEEQARLAEAAAAEALRARLQDADAELTAMTLALEERRREAEETLTLLAATREAEADLNDRLAATLTALSDAEGRSAELDDRLSATLAALSEARGQVETTEDRLAARVQELEAALAARDDQIAEAGAVRAELQERLNALLAQQETAAASAEDVREQLSLALAARLTAESQAATALTDAQRNEALLNQARQTLTEVDEDRIEALREAALLNQQVVELRGQLASLQQVLDATRVADSDQNIQIETLTQDLNAALARVATEQRARAELEAAERARLEAEAQELERFRSEFFGQLRRVLSDREGIEIVGDRFVFSSEVLFDVGAVTLQQEGREQIAEVAEVIRDIANQIPDGIDWILRVDGHTDDIPLTGGGKYSNNWELSQGRALSVVTYLIDEHGIPPSRLAATGFGEYRPVDEGDTPQARARNRRIELKLTER